ncbi:three-helix bundle dimerization domain-containing protein [Nocardia asteroides]|uniref:three-helix bundle dimerization domain-containing protein n=1 Tax=Nocardia asteroides TaxID=1824 RepID=UPI003408D580
MAIEEEKHIDEVVARLGQRYPGVDAITISNVVHDAWTHFESARVREFVPLLVERNASQALEGTAP